ncbi:MAG TPA: hypothetical protein VIY48_18185 [Candidatus Paceibacterota bacterium]
MIDIDGAKFRNADHDCNVNRQIITEAQGYSEDSDPVTIAAAKVYSSEYDPTAIVYPTFAYYPPHIPGKPNLSERTVVYNNGSIRDIIKFL